MARYIVLDNRKLANEFGYPILVGKGWRFGWFNSVQRAQAYANRWLGIHGPIELKVNEPRAYSSAGNMIEIRELIP